MNGTKREKLQKKKKEKNAQHYFKVIAENLLKCKLDNNYY